MPAKRIVRDGAFVSYCHADKKWLERLKVHLKPLERDHNVIIWNDTRLRSGDKWLAEINKALSTPRAAILLISADFLASDFIHTNELPTLLRAAEKEGLVILPVIVGSCAFTHSPLGQFQAVNDPRQPLNLLTEGQADEVFSQLFQRLHNIFTRPAGKPGVVKVSADSKPREAASVRGRARITSGRQKEDPSRSSARTVKQPPSGRLAVAKPAIPERMEPDNPNGFVLLVKKTGDWETVPLTQSRIGESLSLVLKPSTSVQRAFLSSLSQNDTLAGVVCGTRTYLCRLQSLDTRTEGNQESWHLEAARQEIRTGTEITINGINPDMQAEAQARLLLLNQKATEESSPFRYLSSSASAAIKESPFPMLRQQIKNPAAFQRTASLVGIWFLQLSNTVEHILKLELTLKGKILKVHFEGQRSSRYQETPAIIRVSGTCDLSGPAESGILRLGPLNRSW